LTVLATINEELVFLLGAVVAALYALKFFCVTVLVKNFLQPRSFKRVGFNVVTDCG
jgi:hypothetical protein